MKNIINKINNFIKEKRLDKININLILFILFAIITLFIATKHELWRDEAQNWLLNRDLSFFQLIKQLKVEGHPFVWLFFLRIFVKLGIPYEYSFVIPWGISLITIYFILYKMPYPIIIKILVLCTTPFLYISPAFVRSYCIVILLSILLAAYYNDRYKYPYYYGIGILLLLNTHLITCGIPLSLMMISFLDLFKKENRKSALIILGLGILGLILLVLQLYGSGSYYSVDLSLKHIYGLIQSVSTYIVRNNDLVLFLNIIIIFSFLYFLFKKEFYISIIYLCSYCSVIAILIFTHVSYYLCLMVIPGIIFSFWNLKKKTNITIFLFSLFLLFPILGNHYYINQDLKYDYSSGYDVAKYLKRHVPKGSTISCNYIAHCSAIIPYLEKDYYTFYDVIQKEPFTYVDWKKYYTTGRGKWRYPVDSEYAIMVYNKELVSYDNYKAVFISTNGIEEKYTVLKKKDE